VPWHTIARIECHGTHACSARTRRCLRVMGRLYELSLSIVSMCCRGADCCSLSYDDCCSLRYVPHVSIYCLYVYVPHVSIYCLYVLQPTICATLSLYVCHGVCCAYCATRHIQWRVPFPQHTNSCTHTVVLRVLCHSMCLVGMARARTQVARRARTHSHTCMHWVKSDTGSAVMHA